MQSLPKSILDLRTRSHVSRFGRWEGCPVQLSCCRWKPTGETLVDMFGRQAIPMVWDFAEAYPFSESTGDLKQYIDASCAVLGIWQVCI